MKRSNLILRYPFIFLVGFIIGLFIHSVFFTQNISSDTKILFLGSILGSVLGVIGVYFATLQSINKKRELESEEDFISLFYDVEQEIRYIKHFSSIIQKIKRLANDYEGGFRDDFICRENGNIFFNFSTCSSPKLRNLPDKFSTSVRAFYREYYIKANDQLRNLTYSTYCFYKTLRFIVDKNRILINPDDQEWFMHNFKALINDHEMKERRIKETGELLIEACVNEQRLLVIKEACFMNCLTFGIIFPLSFNKLEWLESQIETEFNEMKKILKMD